MLSLIDEADVLGIFHCCQSQLNRWTSKNVIYWCGNTCTLTVTLSDIAYYVIMLLNEQPYAKYLVSVLAVVKLNLFRLDPFKRNSSDNIDINWWQLKIDGFFCSM